jgi:hypothetical protein
LSVTDDEGAISTAVVKITVEPGGGGAEDSEEGSSSSEKGCAMAADSEKVSAMEPLFLIFAAFYIAAWLMKRRQFN